MSQERTEAVVLRGVDFGDTSRIITLLTPARGRISCLAKGVRRGKSPHAAALDTLNRLDILYYWKDSRSVQTLGEVAVMTRYGGIKASLEKGAYAALAAEMVLRIAHENEPGEALYNVFVRGLESLDGWTGEVQAHACWQMVQLLVVAGYEPALETCGDCGAPILGGAGFSFRGGAACGQCASDRRLSRDEHVALTALVRSRDACPPLAGTEPLCRLIRQYAMRQLETDFRSGRVIDELFE